MKTHPMTFIVACLTAALTSAVFVQAQPTTLHRFEAVAMLSSQTVLLSLAGKPTNTFRLFYDFYPVEVSTDLINWQPQAIVVRTNASTNILIYIDADASNQTQRFYRTPTNQFLTPFPKPTGPFAVGTFSLPFNDPSRTNRFSVKTNGMFMATFWYPALAGAGNYPSRVFDPKLAGYAAQYGGNVSLYSVAVGFSIENLPASDVGSPFPVLIYSEAATGIRQENVDKCEELASYGYIVISADHFDTRATVLPNGRLVSGGEGGDVTGNRLADAQLILNQLPQLNEINQTLRGHIDLGRIGMFGWSRGGETSAETCRNDERVKAAAMLDGAYVAVPNLLKLGLQKPFLSMNAASSTWLSGNQQLFKVSTHSPYFMRLRSTDHGTFGMTALFDPSTNSRNAAQAMRACLLSFFNKHLKGEDDHLLDDPSKVFNLIYDFQAK